MLRTSMAWFLVIAPLAMAAEQTVWQIGTPDKSYAEFALARDYKSFPAKFGGKPLVFEVGKSDASRDWPWIQPGPVDFWAGHGTHPFTIRFGLADEPRGIFTLRIEFTDTQGMSPPTYSVTLGGRSGQFRLPAGGGDASLGDPKAGKPHKIELTVPATMFKKGTNDLVLACTEGSWVQYDAVALLNDPEAKMPEPGIRSVTATPTPFHIRRDGKVLRAIDVGVALTAPASDLKIRAEAGGESVEVPVEQLSAFGSVTQEVGVPDTNEPMDVKITATVAGSSKSTTLKILPQRKWFIYVAASSHTDIGYTDIQPKCAETHNRSTDLAAELCDKFPDFKWNLEVAWQAENYLDTRKGEKLEKFLRYAKEGRIGVQALYNNILTGLCSAEEACRLFSFAHSLKTRYGIPYKSAMISDVPTQEASLPMILAGSDIRYFSSGINNDRAYTFNQMYNKCPCWWEGPDGSRVLMMYMPGYAHAGGWGLDASVERARSSVLGAIKGFEGRKDYPYDAIFLHGAVSDNVGMNPRLADVCKTWNDRYEYPKVILAHNAEFFEHIEKKFGDKLPVVRGSAGTYWEDGAGSSAAETALVRNAHEATANAERFFALARTVRPEAAYPAQALYAAWRNCLLYDEHTWGAAGSIGAPESPMTLAQWKIKRQFALDAFAQAMTLLGQSIQAFAALIRTDGRSLVVINPTSWPRTEVLQVKPLERGTVPNGIADGENTLVLVKDVPPCGYRVVKFEDKPDVVGPDTVEGKSTEIESRFYRVTFDATTGAITSLFDKELNRELVDAKAPYKLNQYLYVAGGDGTRIVANPSGPLPPLTISSPEKATTLRRVRFGNLGERMTIETSATMTPSIVIEVTVWNDIKRVDITNRLKKTRTYKKEGVYFAFPFLADKPTFRYECPAGIVNANKDMLPGACLDWFTVQHFVEIESGDAAIAWATPDAPLVCFQDIFRGKWQNKLDLTTGHLFSYAMNNYWHTNYCAGQDGDFTFRYSITSRPKSDNVASAQFGWGVSNPLLAVPVEANANGPLPAGSASLITVAEPNVIVIGTKQAEAGKGLVIRLWELSGQATTAHIRLTGLTAQRATACNLVEDPAGPLEITDGAIAVPIKGFGLATVIVE